MKLVLIRRMMLHCNHAFVLRILLGNVTVKSDGNEKEKEKCGERGRAEQTVNTAQYILTYHNNCAIILQSQFSCFKKESNTCHHQ